MHCASADNSGVYLSNRWNYQRSLAEGIDERHQKVTLPSNCSANRILPSHLAGHDGMDSKVFPLILSWDVVDQEGK